MSDRHSTIPTHAVGIVPTQDAGLIPAVAYYRMSDAKQDKSIAQQRVEMHTLAARCGYRIIREYQDEGISGDAPEDRPGFQRLLKDAREKRDFKAILCWDQDRFLRTDSIDTGYWIKPLRDRGIWLHTEAQGKIDWRDFAGRVVYSVQQESKHAYLVDLSRNVLRGMRQEAEGGRYLGGTPPFGYLLVDGRLVLDPVRAPIVLWLFENYVCRNVGARKLCAELTARGVPTVYGGPWRNQTVYDMLKNRVYVGDYCWNRGHDGDYHRLADGQPVATGKGTPKHDNPEADWIIVREHHEAIVPRALFEAAQEKLARARPGVQPRRIGTAYLLSGLLVCGHCGHHMAGVTPQGQPRGYLCGNYQGSGKLACNRNFIPEAPLLSAILAKLQGEFLNPEHLEALRAEIHRQQRDEPELTDAQVRAVRTRLAELEAIIARGTARLAVVGDDLVADLAAHIRSSKAERDTLAARLEALENPSGVSPAEEEIDRALASLWKLREAIGDGSQDDLRTVLEECIAKIDLHWRHRRTARQTWSHFQRGMIVLKTGDGQSPVLPAAASPIW
jgi:DNA invertase Pin-like site-specific DNA recombinase